MQRYYGLFTPSGTNKGAPSVTSSRSPCSRRAIAHESRGDDAEVAKLVKETKVCPHVVLKLRQASIENHRPAFTKKGAGDTRVFKADAAELYRRLASRCEEYYPTPMNEDEREDGVVPEALMTVVEKGMTVKQRATPLQAKNAVPPAGMEAPEHVFDGVQPQAVVLQCAPGAAAEGNEPVIAAFERQCEVHVSTGNQFLTQWKPQYLSDTFCFYFPRGAGAPDFQEAYLVA